MELAFFSDEISKEDFQEAVRLGVEAGATGVELRGGIWGKQVQEIDDDDVKRIQDILVRYSVQVVSLGSPVGKCAHDNEEEKCSHLEVFNRMVELAHAFDTQIIRGFAFWNPFRDQKGGFRPDLKNYLDLIVSFLEPAVQIAGLEGKTFSLENEAATLVGNCSEAREVENALGNPKGFSYCWDVNNGIDCGECAFPDGYEKIKKKITHLHVKPNPKMELDPIMGSEIVYEDLLKKMVYDGYTGAASIEHWGSPEMMLKGVREFRTVLEKI